jgi:predicted esterase
MNEHHLTVRRNARYFTLGMPGREIWFVLHGYGQLAARFLSGFEPINDGSRLIVAPEALSRFYVDHADRKVGASWMTREDRLAEIADYVPYLDAVFQDALGSVERSGVTVHVLGFSQGAATGSRWVAQGAVVPDRLILWGGEVPPDLPLDRSESRDRLSRVRLTLVVGSRDEFVTPKVLARDTGRLDAAGVRYSVVRYEGGHEIDAKVLGQLTADG